MDLGEKQSSSQREQQMQRLGGRHMSSMLKEHRGSQGRTEMNEGPSREGSRPKRGSQAIVRLLTHYKMGNHQNVCSEK